MPKRQKLIGLKGNKKGSTVGDDTALSDLKAKGSKGDVIVHQFILMGTPEEHIFVDPSEKEDLPDIIDDFDLDFNAGSEEVSPILLFVNQSKRRGFIHSCSGISYFFSRQLLNTMLYIKTVGSA